ncbi:MAG: GTPase HflX [Oscillospiraceae bacterium]|nr:GTPase HflX [Oscillospiraceae bacterium]
MNTNHHQNEMPTLSIVAAADTGEYDADVSVDELEELAQTAGSRVVAKVVQKLERPLASTYLGQGKIEEIAELCEQFEVELVVFDDELSSSQIRNIERLIGEKKQVRVIDRTMLILDIFAARAVSGEGKLQVELAQLKYRLPRLSGMGTALSRLGGGIGTRGPGETQLETDRRHIRRRISKLSNELKELQSRRDFMRSRRKKDRVLTGAIVGYTNAGKSTLLNKLTNAGVLEQDKLFVTLDLTSRAVTLPDGRELLLIDTVGLIRRLPHHLVEAFKSTLEEAKNADIILHLADASDEQVYEKTKTTEKILSELGCGGIPIVTILNKCDRRAADGSWRAAGETAETAGAPLEISAKTGYGLERMLEVLAKTLPETAKRVTLLIPYAQAGLTSKIRENGIIYSEEFLSDGIKVNALVDVVVLNGLQLGDKN